MRERDDMTKAHNWQTMTLRQMIDSLQPGESKKSSEGAYGMWCSIERSGDGETLRFVRHYPAVEGAHEGRVEVFGTYRYHEFV